jgi:diguanylate cyclase (GGDEF)-like protein
MFTISVILIADLFGVVPKKELITLDARKKICEVLAVQLSIAVSKSEFDIVETSLQYFVERNNDVLAASMSTMDGNVISEYGDFEKFNLPTQNSSRELSTDNVVVVPVFSGADRWGSVNIEFSSMYGGNFFSLLSNSIFGVILFVALGCFAGYLVILRKTLKVLDPKSVVPERVRAAFNTLSEGVLIIDKREQIIMANNAFAKKLNKNPDELLGTNASSFKWKHINNEMHKLKVNMPWISTIKDGINKIGVSLKLSTPDSGVRSFSTNCAAIHDDNGNTRGALVTFDDITDVHETNISLENAVNTLTENENKIKRKNIELEVLATRDHLTGCYNRRAFFDLFEKSLEKANKEFRQLSCIMMDIDHFKSINDNYGHAIGDEAIRMIADILNHHCDKDNTIIGRYGGEEFCIVLPDTAIDDAVKIAEYLRLTIQTTSKGFCMENMSITSSFGVTSSKDKNGDCSILLDQADKALYEAKEHGRNRVVKWQEDNVDNNTSAGVVVSLNKMARDRSKVPLNDKTKITLLTNEIKELENKLASLKKAESSSQTRSIDPVTKLPSKLIFIDRVNQAISHSQRNKKLLAVAMLNVDMFSRINDTMGRTIGDEFLREVGFRLKSILRQSDTVASMLSSGHSGPLFSRLEGDNFALLLTGFDDIDSLTYVIKRIQKKFEGNIKVSGKEVYLNSRIGISVSPQDGETAHVLIENASRAKKQAKASGARNKYQFYSQIDNRMIIEQMQSEIELRNAIEHKQFAMFYQPKLELKSNTITSIEALIRWNHPDKGIITPDDFIPVAERTGMITEIGKWCLQTACKQTKLWVEQGATSIRTSVNVSALEFSDEDFKNNVLHALQDADLKPRHLEIEITESTIMDDSEATHRLIEELRFIGVTITLDDFGTGYSSLSHFGNLELDWLKLDKTFLVKAMENDRSRNIYSSIIKMVHATGVKVVSEGIETREHFDYVKKLNVDEIQGYLLSKPVNSASMTDMLFSDLHKKTVAINS